MTRIRTAALVLLAVLLSSCIVVVQEAPPPARPKAPELPKIKGNVEIVNPSFEREDGLPHPWETVVHASAYAYDFDILPEAARTGNAGIRIKRDGNEPWGGIVQVLDIGFPAGQKGTLSAWIRSPELTGHVEFFVRLFPVRGQPVYHVVRFPAERSSSEWQEVTLDFESDVPVRRVWVGATLYDGESVDLDDFSLTLR